MVFYLRERAEEESAFERYVNFEKRRNPAA
jgi:hypothetical protein